MLTWSTSTTSLNPNGNRNGKSETRVGEEFLKTWDDAVFDGKVMNYKVRVLERKMEEKA